MRVGVWDMMKKQKKEKFTTKTKPLFLKNSLFHLFLLLYQEAYLPNENSPNSSISFSHNVLRYQTISISRIILYNHELDLKDRTTERRIPYNVYS